MSKTQFVLEHPEMKASEVVAEAKRLGFSLSRAMVYAVRGGPSKKAQGPSAAVPTSAPTGASVEKQFKALVLRIGLDRAHQILRAIAS